LKFKAVAEKTAKDSRGLLYFAAPCMSLFKYVALVNRGTASPVAAWGWLEIYWPLLDGSDSD